jgi:hypothetical protein
VPAVLLEHWYEQLSRHLGLQYIAANHRNERKGNDNDGDYHGDNGGIDNNDNDINGSNGNNIDNNDVDNDNNNSDNNDNSSSSSSNNDNDKKVNIQRNKLNSIFQFNPNKKDSGIIDHNNDDNNNDDNSDNINDINDNNDDNHNNMNINEVLNNLNINTMSDLRGVVYIDGLGDIVDVQPPLANLQVRLYKYLYKSYVCKE